MMMIHDDDAPWAGGWVGGCSYLPTDHLDDARAKTDASYILYSLSRSLHWSLYPTFYTLVRSFSEPTPLQYPAYFLLQPILHPISQPELHYS